jgi:hypothetical protein
MDNHINAQIVPPFLVSTEGNDIQEVRGKLTDYHTQLIDRVYHLSPTIGWGYRPDLIDDSDIKQPIWITTRVENQPVKCLIDLITLVENHTEIIKAGYKV